MIGLGSDKNEFYQDYDMTRCIHLRAWLVKYGMRAQKENTARSKNMPGGKMVEFRFSDDFSEFLRKRHMW